MMKKSLILLYVGWLSVSALGGSFTYRAGWNGEYFMFDSMTSVGMTTSVYREYTDGFLESDQRASDYGFYKLDGRGYGSLFGDAAGTFNAGDRIGIWMKDISGSVYTSTRTGSGEAHFGGVGQNGEEFCLYPNGTGALLTPSHYEYQLHASAAPSGQPLRGGLAVVLAVGGALWAGQEFSKRSRA